MMKKLPILCLTLVLGLSSMAQNGVLPITAKAARLYQGKSYTEAKEVIERSLAGEGAKDAYTWQVRGHIYKEIFKQMEKYEMNSQARETSVISFLKCMELDSEGKYLEWNSTSLRFLASTYWNDAVSIMEEREREKLGTAFTLYERYRDIMSSARPDEDLNKFSVDFFKAYATSNRKLIEERRSLDVTPSDYKTELERVEDSYQLALKMKQDDYGSNYNYAINLYNEAAYRIGKIDPEAELTEVMLIQIGCMEIFNRALPIAQKAQDLRPGRIEILKALRAIHLSLSNYDEFDHYNTLVREKQGELIIDKATKRELNRKYFQSEKFDD
jgi:hypothetical protein